MIDTGLEKTYKALPLAERMALAVSDALPREYRALMLREQWMQIKCYFARRADLTAEEYTALLDDDDHVIRLCIAKRGDLPIELIERCASDRDPNVRYFIARNPGLTETLRQRLLADPDPLVRRAAAKGPKPVEYRQRPGQTRLIR